MFFKMQNITLYTLVLEIKKPMQLPILLREWTSTTYLQ